MGAVPVGGAAADRSSSGRTLNIPVGPDLAGGSRGEGPSGGDGVRALRVYVAAARARSRRCSRLHVRP